jgi:hypothetical protein
MAARAEALDLAASCEIRVLQREVMDGRDALLLTVKPNANHRPTTAIGELATRFDIRVWIDEDRHNVIRLEAELLAPIYLDLIFRQGSEFLIERRAAPENQWLPIKTEVSIPRFGRMAARYSDFERFVTDVLLKFGTPVDLQQP